MVLKHTLYFSLHTLSTHPLNPPPQPTQIPSRSPWPIINILRTPMVKAAQKGIPEGRVFSTNEERLNAVGRYDRLID